MYINLQSIGSASSLHLPLLVLLATVLALPITAQPAPAPSPAVSLLYNGQAISMVQNNSLNWLFEAPGQTFSCSNVYKFTYNQTNQQMAENAGYTIVVEGMAGLFRVQVGSVHGKLRPTQNVTACEGGCAVEIRNNCENNRSFDAIRVSITGLPQVYYNVICNSELIFSPFQYGLIVLVVFSVLQIIVCSKFQECNSFSNSGHYINYLSLALFCLVIVAGQALILVQIPTSTDLVSYMCLTVSAVAGVCGVWVVMCEGLYAANKRLFAKRLCPAKLGVRVMDVMGLLAGGGLFCALILTDYNWIISDVIYIAIFLSITKLIKFGSLQMAFVTFLATATLNIIFIALTQNVKHTYFNNLILFLFNNPFFIFCPCISFTPNQACSWLFITCIVFPCMLLCYLDRFDESRGSRIYFVVFCASLVVCSTLWMVVSRFVPFTLPFDLINSPICIALLCVFANRRGELQSLWNGEIFDAKHRNKSEQEHELIVSLKEDRSASYKSDWFRIKFSNVSSISMASVLKNAANDAELKDAQDKLGGETDKDKEEGKKEGMERELDDLTKFRNTK